VVSKFKIGDVIEFDKGYSAGEEISKGIIKEVIYPIEIFQDSVIDSLYEIILLNKFYSWYARESWLIAHNCKVLNENT
jgi:hypothetical protein